MGLGHRLHTFENEPVTQPNNDALSQFNAGLDAMAALLDDTEDDTPNDDSDDTEEITDSGGDDISLEPEETEELDIFADAMPTPVTRQPRQPAISTQHLDLLLDEVKPLLSDFNTAMYTEQQKQQDFVAELLQCKQQFMSEVRQRQTADVALIDALQTKYKVMSEQIWADLPTDITDKSEITRVQSVLTGLAKLKKQSNLSETDENTYQEALKMSEENLDKEQYYTSLEALVKAHKFYNEKYAAFQKAFNSTVASAKQNIQRKQSAKEAEKQAEQLIRKHAMSAELQSVVDASFSALNTQSATGCRVALSNLSNVVLSCIKAEYGVFDKVVSFCIKGDNTIVINGEPLMIHKQIDIPNNNLCDRDINDLNQGHWGSCFDFADLHNFRYLSELDLSGAQMPILVSARRELRVVKGKWKKLFKQFPMLESIKLPDTVITRGGNGLAGIFRSEREYDKQLSNAVAQRDGGTQGGGGAAVLDTMRGIKDVLWSKPVPRTIIKTLGYGIGVPAYLGMMAALSPFAMVLGAIGIGALAHHEVKSYKEKGHL